MTLVNQALYQHYPPQILRIYLYYRLSLAAVLYIMYHLHLSSNVLGGAHPTLFKWSVLSYIIICIASLFTLHPKRFDSLVSPVLLLLGCDLIAMMMLIHTSGGIQSGLGYLLLITTAMGSMFLPNRLSIGFAALVSLVTLAESLLISTTESELSRALFSSGILGILIFITALMFSYLTRRIQESDKKAKEQAIYANHLHTLAKSIVERMQTGIIVLNEANDIDLINQSAIALLDLPKKKEGLKYTAQDITSIIEHIAGVKNSPDLNMPITSPLKTGQEVRLSFAKLDAESQNNMIIFIEDNRTMIQQAQQLKLASLGRLTASIAHEVRNPLGAIAHAAQLLSESPDIVSTDTRLIEIILDHSNRVNIIVENTMVLSRRKEPKLEHIALATWLPKFAEEYKATHDAIITLHINATDLLIKMDPTHLSQVLTNLVDNGIRYSHLKTGQYAIEIIADLNANNETPLIEIIDDGPGVPIDKEAQIFDPFYTSEESGSGLGLYISKELCEINKVNLHYSRTEQHKCCFRLDFPHYQRMS